MVKMIKMKLKQWGRPLNEKKKNRFEEIDLSKSIWPCSNRFEPCFPLQNYRFSPQIDSNRWRVRERTIDRYNCQIRNITIPVIDLSRFFGKSLRVWVVERARIFTQWGFKVLTVCVLGFRAIGMEEAWLYFYFFVFSSFKHRVKSILTQIDSNRFFDQIFSRLSIALRD